MKYKSFILSAMVGTALLSSSCQDEFAKLNTNPGSITDANIPYLFAQGVSEFEPAGYIFWFYNTRYFGQWVQSYAQTGGYTDQFNIMGPAGSQGEQSLQILKYAREIDNAIELLGPEEGSKFQQIRAVLNPLMVYLGIFDNDVYGSRPFSEACMARFGGTLTPKYDTVDDLYTQYLTMLDEALKAFSTPSGAQTFPSNQDAVYKGDLAKWSKLTNSLRLKIAVRLLHKDRAKAIKLAEEVVASSAGVLDGTADDFIFSKGINDHHFGDDVSQVGAPTKPVVDFLIKNKDPRVRFFYEKNQFNSKVVQAFFDTEVSNPGGNAKLPAYILANVNYEVIDGKKVFKSWKGLGEPWVRYYGLPTEIGAATQAAKYGDYFEKIRWEIGPSTGKKEYTPYAIFNQEMVRGQKDFTVPTVPGGPVIQDLNDNAWWGMYMTTAEVNLYLAEFKLLGANLPKSASEYYNKAVRSSVEVYNRMAALNKVPYYGTTYSYDENEKPIDLQDGEIDAMMANEDYQLTGSAAEQLEKVYIQQYMHFMYLPSDQFTTARRSGVPKYDSKYLARDRNSENTVVPRRFDVGVPSPTDLMFQITTDAYAAQGFTPSANNTPALLNSERLWQDQGAPNYGEGPNY